jgi:hypothetical protein
VTFGWRASEAEDALQVDIYLESLLASHDRSPEPMTDGPLGDDLAPSERRAAKLLADHLVRFHPSFRFEEALAARLRAVVDHAGPAIPTSATVLPFPVVGADDPPAPDGTATTAWPERAALLERRRVLIGGAIASGVSLAGAAIVAWRASTPPRSAFGRATRAAHRNRPTAGRRI